MRASVSKVLDAVWMTVGRPVGIVTDAGMLEGWNPARPGLQAGGGAGLSTAASLPELPPFPWWPASWLPESTVKTPPSRVRKSLVFGS